MFNDNVAVEPNVFKANIAKTQTVSKSKDCKQVNGNTKKSPPPYHIFTVLGNYFVFDTSGCRFYKIDELAYRFLELCLSCSISEAQNALLMEGNFSSQEIERIAQEIILLSENGLFDKPSPYFDEESFKKNLDQIDKTAVIVMELILTDSCNLACKYCYCAYQHKASEPKFMTKYIARKAVDKFFELSKSAERLNIVLFGGEPLLNKSVFYFVVNYAKNKAKIIGKKLTFTVTTNGTLIDDKMIECFKDNDIAVMVSIDGPREIHDRQCPMRGNGAPSYDFVINGIEKLLKAGITTEARCTIIKPMLDMKRLVAFYEQYNFSRIILAPAINIAENENQFDFTCEDYAEFINQLEKIIPHIIKNFSDNNKNAFYPYHKLVNQIINGLLSLSFPVAKCKICHSSISVDPLGNFYPCSKFYGMEQWKVGNVTKGFDYERCKKLWFEYRNNIADQCESCWAYPVCQGPCPWEISKCNGTFQKPRFCNPMRQFIEQAAYIASTLAANPNKAGENL